LKIPPSRLEFTKEGKKSTAFLFPFSSSSFSQIPFCKSEKESELSRPFFPPIARSSKSHPPARGPCPSDCKVLLLPSIPIFISVNFGGRTLLFSPGVQRAWDGTREGRVLSGFRQTLLFFDLSLYCVSHLCIASLSTPLLTLCTY